MAFNSPIALTNKNILFCFVGIIVIFVVTDYFLLNQLVSEKIIKNESFDFLSSNVTDKCQFTDPLMQSALERVKSESCRQSLKDVYCQVLDSNVELENSCSDFDKTKLNKFVGCFDDSPSGFLLTGYHYNFPKTNAPDLCVQTCFRSAYELAGLKSGKHCFCGDSTDLKKGLEVDESICRSLSCPGNANLTCGGIKSTAVISTGLAKIERPMPEFIPLPDDIETRKRVKILFVLQLNGRNSRQVTRMIRTIYSRDHFYLVHVDQRQNFMFSEMKELQKLFEKKKLFNFKVTENRFATIWGGSTLLTMFLQTIKDSLTSLGWNDWDYVLNMSESDMPLLSLEELEHNLALNNGFSSM
uniref:WSC domain-containing protein n=1 Tax=Panagrolaimus sp. JU765 TaxID=591449 RepID=A0AC34QZ13_9BILA